MVAGVNHSQFERWENIGVPMRVSDFIIPNQEGGTSLDIITSSLYKSSLQEKSKSCAQKVSRKKPGPSTKKRKVNTTASRPAGRTNDVNPDWLYCNEKYLHSAAGEIWIQCSRCFKWAHQDCSSFEDGATDFVCEICIE